MRLKNNIGKDKKHINNKHNQTQHASITISIVNGCNSTIKI